MVKQEAWVLVVTEGVSMSGERVIGEWTVRRQQADVRLC